ncbi:hypothetical protein L6452_31594 [Arctium lappa]|uniref:Uncharacterized protein n=1 Tax=Arctium lappa TaxID=4217 RepID=A0ACB8Z1G9_ARCLA|nr:hypothetical protein L6452_31594 [Arctium lappa]
MNENQKFEQIWGFRRNIDTSSDDSKSNSDVGNAREKLRLVPSLVFPETDRVSETNDQGHVQVEKKTKRVRNGPKNGLKNGPKKEKKNKREVKTKSKKDSSVSSNVKKGNNGGRMKKKSKLISQMTVSDDFRIFTESILDDLRVARETMFAKMRKEMNQLVKSKKTPSRSIKQKGNGNGSNQAKKPNPKPRSRKTKTVQEKPKNTELAASKGLDCNQEPVKNENAKEPSAKNPILVYKNPVLIDKNPVLIDKNPIFIDSPAKKPIFTNIPDQNQIVTSSYLTLPLVLSNSRSNDTSLKLERGNYSGLQEERFRSFAHNESSCVGNGYPVGLNHHHHHHHQRFDNTTGFGIPNRVVQGFSHDGSNLLGTRIMNGGIRYGAGLAAGHTLPNHLASNGYRSLYPN